METLVPNTPKPAPQTALKVGDIIHTSYSDVRYVVTKISDWRYDRHIMEVLGYNKNLGGPKWSFSISMRLANHPENKYRNTYKSGFGINYLGADLRNVFFPNDFVIIDEQEMLPLMAVML